VIGTLVGPGVLLLAVAASNNRSNNDGLTQALVFTGLTAMLLGPSAGRWYAGETGAGQIALRGAGVSLMFVGAIASICLDSCSGDNTGPGVLILGGLGLFVGSTIYDVATAGDAARRYNHMHHGQQFSIAPTYNKRDGVTTSGLMVSGSF
jgi:FtsH-binding integral membrane protein